MPPPHELAAAARPSWLLLVFCPPGHHDLVQLLLYSPANLLPQTPNPNPGGGGSGGSGKMPMPALVHDDDDE